MEAYDHGFFKMLILFFFRRLEIARFALLPILQHQAFLGKGLATLQKVSICFFCFLLSANAFLARLKTFTKSGRFFPLELLPFMTPARLFTLELDFYTLRR